ncbi:MAG: NAD-dependent epimerase/dehydratase family protein [Bacteroidota bacterium]
MNCVRSHHSAHFASQNNFEYTRIRRQSQSTNVSSRGSIRKVCVTGGTGFIGSHAVETLLRRGYSVRCLVRPDRATLGWLEGLPVEIVRVSLHDQASLVRMLDSSDVVVHIAGVTKAKNRKEFFRDNVLATRNLLEAAVQSGTIGKFVFISSLTAAGPSPDGIPLDETAPCRPITSYGASKLEAERLCLSYADRLQIVVLRLPAVYGPRDHDILQMFRMVKMGFAPIMGPREKTLSLAYVTDVAEAIAVALASPHTAGKLYYVSDPEPYTYLHLVDLSARLLNTRVTRVPVPSPVIFALAALVQFGNILVNRASVLNIDKVRDLITPAWTCNPSRIYRDLGFQTAVRAEEGLRITLQWYREHGWL